MIMTLLIIFIIVLVIAALTVATSVWSTHKSAKDLYSDVSFSWNFKVRRKSKGSVAWYCEYHNGIRIYDHFSIMIANYPILTFRVFDDPHTDSWTTYTLGFLVFFDLVVQIKWGGKWLGEEWNPDMHKDVQCDLDERREEWNKVLEQKRKDLEDQIKEFHSRRTPQ